MATRSETRHQSLDDLDHLAAKCPRCSLCKFPPLVAVRSHARSSICPSYDEYKYHSHSGSGRVIIANALHDGRIDVTEGTRDVIFQCTMCGGCDMSCKFSTDIEISEIMFALRAESHERCGPLPAHAQVLDNLRGHGHPFDATGGSKDDWLAEITGVRTGLSKRVLLVGSSYALLPDRRRTLLNLVRLLQVAGVEFTVLGADEPDTGTMALHIGDRDLFDTLARDFVGIFNTAGVEEIVCADPEDFATLRAHFGKVGDLHATVRHAVEVLDEAVAAGSLTLRHRVSHRATYHDPCSLGRRSEEYQAWDGETKKIMGQLIVTDPPRPVNRGTHGVYEPPRRLLQAVPGLELVEMPRRREYAYCCGGSGGVPQAYPEFASHTAHERLDEAGDVGAEIVVSACPGCERNLDGATDGRGVEVLGIYDVLAEAAFGNRG
ncbi:MAG: (Fe-S)-binding protein [Acidimicrobiia bacterium]|nr:(Fe-S)-binding protein [Acidimicrobiia bacterium]